MDSYWLIRHNIQDYIKFNTAYSEISAPVLMEVLNTRYIFTAIKERAVEITKTTFESNIPNNQVGVSYVDFYDVGGCFYELFDDTDNTATYFIIVQGQIVLFFEVKKSDR